MRPRINLLTPADDLRDLLSVIVIVGAAPWDYGVKYSSRVLS